jgi:hypothetical protein
MRILDEDKDQKVDRVTLYLTQSEAGELRDSLESILENPKDNHAHVSSADYQKEITVVVYDHNDTILQGFGERSKKLILEDQ